MSILKLDNGIMLQKTKKEEEEVNPTSAWTKNYMLPDTKKEKQYRTNQADLRSNGSCI